MRHMLCIGIICFLLNAVSCACAEMPEPTPSPSFVVFAQGWTGAEVRAIQTRLTQLGYYNGRVSGSFGETTKESVLAFQEDFAINPTGIVDEITWTVMMSATYRPISYGDSGEDVKRLQKRLTVLGYYTGKLSGYYLEATSEAVSDFQKKMGLLETGIADINLQEALFSDKAISRTGKAATTPAPAQAEKVTNAEASDEEDSTETGDNIEPYKNKLTKGSKGTQVKKLQQRLDDLGYFKGKVTGTFATKTREAVIAFQKQNGYHADGIVDEETWNAIFNQQSVVMPENTPKPTATPAPVPFHITVDVTNQVVTVFGRDESGAYTEIVRQMICSTGTKKNPSDLGDWVLNGRKTVWCKFPTWGDYARYWTRINSSIAFHSVIYNTVSVMDLSTKSYRALGSRASHGCIRLLVSDAKWIYDNVGEGTVVTIRDDLPSDPELHAALMPPALNTKTMLPVSTPQPTAEPVYVSGACPPLPLRTMKKNSSGEDVYWLQKKLKEIGLYQGSCTGTYLNGTVDAVKAFQRSVGLNANGNADEKTLAILYANELRAPASPTPMTSSLPTV